jgi:hypothetical protein
MARYVAKSVKMESRQSSFKVCSVSGVSEYVVVGGAADDGDGIVNGQGEI